MTIKYLALFYLLAAYNIPVAYSQSDPANLPHLTADMIDENGLLSFGGSEHWKYQPGDDLQWADPEFDDSGWYDISPGGLGIDEMPDSLWNGYGWWRFTFTADSSFYNENWNLYFFGYGAAEVYLDGQRVHQFGNFSGNPEHEKTYAPVIKLHPPIKITEKDTHIFAIRYSFHQAKQYNIPGIAHTRILGFGFGFGTHAINQYRAKIISNYSFILFISAAVLFVLFLLHMKLYLKFPEDRSNLLISTIVGALLISVVAALNSIYLDATMYWSVILEHTWGFTSLFGIAFLPYVIAITFRFEKYKGAIWLTAAAPLGLLSDIFTPVLTNYLYLSIYSISLFLLGHICWKAHKADKRGLKFIAFGVLGTLAAVFIWLFSELGWYEINLNTFSVVVVLIYTLFPLGMTLYVADSYGYLFTSLESEISDRTKKLKQSLEELKATQSQLVQQEKLASLGQLTAGIAHEIKNPLNFVNNFSELSLELIEEVRDEVRAYRNTPLLDKGAEDISDLIDDIETNLRKIYEHGSRADSIVKSMLEHSRGGSGKMEPTDLNGLVKEFTNFSFHGMRAGKNPINVDIDLQLDDSLGKIPLIAEDFSRVILNLCNNAFDAMRSVFSMSEDSVSGGYIPKLTVRTRKPDNNTITIEIEDNGPGIPDEIKDKILLPFFTTKKGTQGTGLGLSITNDIIKAHGGEIDIKTSINGTIMTITLNNFLKKQPL